MSDNSDKLGLNATWSMAVGGMVGGGIFSTLGVVIQIAGAWAWLSFVVAGCIALLSGYSYVKLAEYYGEGGGAFTFLREINANEFAGSLSWVLIVGYILTNAVYAMTFGEYLAHVAGLGHWFAPVCAVAIVTLFILLNLKGTSESGGVEIFLVWFKLFVLIGLAAFGLMQWKPDMLSHNVPDSGIASALFGAASIFMAYEGFQLLTYDYDDIDQPKKTLPLAVLSAIVVVTIVYVIVAVGTASLIGADKIVAHKEFALSIAGEEALGMTGLVLVTVAAAFSTGSAINSTLFATARLSHLVAQGGELPVALEHRNHAGVPDRSIIALGAAAAILAVVGSLGTLVEAASLSFLFTFASVCGLAFWQKAGNRLITGVGAVSGTAATIALLVRLYQKDLPALLFLGALVLIAIFVRPWILKHVKVEDPSDSEK